MSDKLTYGQKAVGLNFNPSGDDKVFKVKQMYADIIDMINLHRQTNLFCEMDRIAEIAITEAQGAQMWAVKALTWKD